MNEEVKEAPRFCKMIDETIRHIGEYFSWLNAILVVVIILQVVLRYVFGQGLVVLEELQWHLYGVGIMLGLSYCVVTDSHIRLDLLYDRFPQRGKEQVELFGNLVLVLPIVAIILLHGWPFLMESWRVGESSDSPIGICCRYVIKSFLLIGFGLLGVAALSKTMRSFAFLLKKD
ncbi:MAG: TRAP transporter small permease subunit [Nitrospinaceae bacterium]|nr:TRAP transporter small permease subunit [Nitrospinaceae bacterium]HJO63350.1 TRAP transporter small permease subunit [Desulfobacterales bacterium]